MAERLSVEQDVVGSSPTSLPMLFFIFLCFAQWAIFCLNDENWLQYYHDKIKLKGGG